MAHWLFESTWAQAVAQAVAVVVAVAEAYILDVYCDLNQCRVYSRQNWNSVCSVACRNGYETGRGSVA